MELLPAIGATCLGIVIGWLVRYFLKRFKNYTPQILGSLISILFGGAILFFLEKGKDAIWFYPIGLLIGFIVYSMVAYLVKRGKIKDDDGVYYSNE